MAKRRSMGALDLKPGNPLVQLAAVGIGYFMAADPVNEFIDKQLSKKEASGATTPPTAQTKKIVAVATTGAGAALVLMGKKTMVKTLGGGVLAGVGLKRALKEFNIISGYQNVPVLAGYQNVPVLAGAGINSAGPGYAVNGAPGYAVNGSSGINAMQ